MVQLYDVEKMLEQAKAHPGRYVKAFRGVSRDTYYRMRNGEHTALRDLPDGALSVIGGTEYLGQEGRMVRDVFVRWNEGVPTEDLQEPDFIERRKIGRPRTNPTPRSKASIQNQPVSLMLSQRVRKAAQAAGVPVAQVLNGVIRRVLEEGSDFEPPKPKPKPKREKLNSTVTPDEWEEFAQLAASMGQSARAILRYELGKDFGVEFEDTL